MIDIVRTLREQHPDLGPFILALRSHSGLVAMDQSGRLRPEVQDWADERTPTARLLTRVVRYASEAGGPLEERSVEVVEFATAAELTSFVLRWT